MDAQAQGSDAPFSVAREPAFPQPIAARWELLRNLYVTFDLPVTVTEGISLESWNCHKGELQEDIWEVGNVSPTELLLIHDPRARTPGIDHIDYLATPPVLIDTYERKLPPFSIPVPFP